MPELPEVETTKRGIEPYLINQQIKAVVVRQPKLRFMVNPELKKLNNARVLGLSRRAKYLIIHTNKGDIVGHLGMSGTLQVMDDKTPAQKHDHIDFLIDNHKILRYHDPRRFGAWLWAEHAEDLPILQKLGVEPLEKEFSAEYLFNHSCKRKMPVKSLLMHNPIVVGVGNIYANESLFLCGINPALPANLLTLTDCEKLVPTIKKVLKQSIKQGGTTLKDFKQPDGKLGYFVQKLHVYGKKGEPCPKCKTQIESLVIGQRNSFFCPKCQPLLKSK